MTLHGGLSTGIAYRRPIEEVIPVLHAAGIRRVEIATSRGHVDLFRPDAIREFRKRLDALDMRACSLHAPFGHQVDITDPSEEFRRRSFELLDRAADAARILGSALYVIHPGGENADWVWDRKERLARSVEGLRRMADVCRDHGLVLVVETALPHLLGGQLADLAHILDQLPSHGVGVCLDTSHTSLHGALFTALHRFGGRLLHVQASDNHGKTDDHLPPGAGVLPWHRFVTELRHVHYRGTFLLEVSGHGDPRKDVARCLETASKALPELRW